MRGPILLALFVCGCASVDTYPVRKCLYDGSKRWVSGVVIARRDDGARLFRYDDPSQGDHGFRWVDDDDKSLGPCRGESITEAEPR